MAWNMIAPATAGVPGTSMVEAVNRVRAKPSRSMVTIGDRPARDVTAREVEDLLRLIASTGVAARTVNKARQLICAIFNYGMRPSTYALATNPAQHADRRREPDAAPLAF